jgi:hypothetical protein
MVVRPGRISNAPPAMGKGGYTNRKQRMGKMSKPVSISKIRAKLERAIERDLLFIEGMQKDHNPQVVEMVIQCKAEKQAFEAALYALQGDNALLNCYID